MSQFLPDYKSVAAYLDEMKTDGTYADDFAVSALSSALDLPIRVVSQGHGEDNVFGSGNNGPELIVGHSQALLHYVSLEP